MDAEGGFEITHPEETVVRTEFRAQRRPDVAGRLLAAIHTQMSGCTEMLLEKLEGAVNRKNEISESLKN